ncbi:hypothetical protein JQ554_18410 [Bradyrhizobium diazoefficiens]|jgi:hypothetical protein|nr:hypothetical protein [Bradyrhizobium diazoefficiens]UCF52638.1 MAG: hypothetical protein JSV48_26120 [Bradyrhizobium sp.]MBR0966183.1 hypothetical protein [Bradyrhizobium diazoefficiens]MBR0979653.1 hypothetical protein [Bradyrhizobium diazoefficiens]MBR1009001.1 hypothetical protein [Bradyrhizobium diazoefficiens]MBR1015449.1 hypothetical protein [Bradyrhizobium diazoefficiens]
MDMVRFLFFGEVSSVCARQPVRARLCDTTTRYVRTTMDKAATKIKYAPGKTNSGLRNIAARN